MSLPAQSYGASAPEEFAFVEFAEFVVCHKSDAL